MVINRNLSVNGCWKMVNAIQNGGSPVEIRERANIAEQWLMSNDIIDNDTFDELMNTVAFIVRESYHM